MVEVTTTWLKDNDFKAEVSGNVVAMSANYDNGASPKQLLLAGLAGCTGIDVCDMLKKMRVTFAQFQIIVIANQTLEHPKIYDYIKITYKFVGNNIDLQKVEKAVKLSKEKYCGVSAMLAKSAKIEYEIIITQ